MDACYVTAEFANMNLVTCIAVHVSWYSILRMYFQKHVDQTKLKPFLEYKTILPLEYFRPSHRKANEKRVDTQDNFSSWKFYYLLWKVSYVVLYIYTKVTSVLFRIPRVVHFNSQPLDLSFFVHCFCFSYSWLFPVPAEKKF